MSKELSPADQGINHLVDLICRTDKEKPTAADRAELDRILLEDPSVWRVAGDVMQLAGDKLIQDIGRNSSYAITQSLKTGKTQLQKELTRPGDGELERLLIQQVILAWLKLAYTEYHHEHFLTNGNTTIKVADFWERRLSAAQRRYLRACETLARVRRLNLPAVQVNIGAQQVNQVNAFSD